MKTTLIACLMLSCIAPINAFAAEAGADSVHEHMRRMEDTMAAIRAEQDPAHRAELMHEHHEMMRAGMAMMEHTDSTGMTLEERVANMEEHMGMMHSMMGHMMESHEVVGGTADAAPGHEHGQ